MTPEFERIRSLEQANHVLKERVEELESSMNWDKERVEELEFILSQFIEDETDPMEVAHQKLVRGIQAQREGTS